MKKRPSWNVVPFGSLAEFRNGVNFTNRNFGRGIKVVNVKDFQDYFKPRYAELDEINPEGVVRDDDILQEDDLLFVRSNGNRALIGRSLFIKGASEAVTYSAFTIRARIKSQEAVPLFYAYALRTDLVRRALSAHGGGTNINNLNQGILSTLQVPIPPLAAQRKIAAVLSAYDESIENSKQRIKRLEQMARAVYCELFVRRREDEEWEEKSIGEVIETLGGGTPSTKNPEFWKEGDVIWFTPSDVTAADTMFITDSGKKITRAGLNGSSARLFPAYSVMMTSRATIGVVAINTKGACTNQGFIVCVPSERVSAFQIYFWIEENRDKIISIASGATYKEISRSEFRELPIGLPPPGIARRFVNVVQPIGKLIENLQVKGGNLRNTRDLLLPKLISGEVEVSDLNISVEAPG